MNAYTITGSKEYETQHGMIFEEPAIDLDASNPKQAELAAKKLYEQGGYSSIHISYAHPQQAQCYYNPIDGHESSGVNWISHLEV